jgi:ABC-type transporter Mla subunit MlaD
MVELDLKNSVVEIQRREHVTFFYVFALGALAVVLMHFLLLPQLVVTAFTMLLMIGYMIFELRSGRYQYREDRLGDDLYYLGLLFTLVSLALSLRIFGRGFMSRAEAIDELIANFGIAIFTTITGLALRVGLYKWRGDELEEPELRARIDLAEATGLLKTQLMFATEDMKSFRLSLAQSLADLVSNSTDKVAAAIEDGLNKVTAQAAAAKEAFEKGLEGLSEPLGHLDAMATKAEKELEQLVQRVRNIAIPPDLLERELVPALKLITRHARAVEKAIGAEEERSRQMSETLAALGSFGRQADEQLQRMVRSAESLTSLGPSLSEAAKAIEGLIAMVGTANEQLKTGAAGSSQALASLTSAGREYLDGLRNNRELLEQETTKWRDVVNKVQEGMVSLTSLTIDRLDNGRG